MFYVYGRRLLDGAIEDVVGYNSGCIRRDMMRCVRVSCHMLSQVMLR